MLSLGAAPSCAAATPGPDVCAGPAEALRSAKAASSVPTAFGTDAQRQPNGSLPGGWAGAPSGRCQGGVCANDAPPEPSPAPDQAPMGGGDPPRGAQSASTVVADCSCAVGLGALPACSRPASAPCAALPKGGRCGAAAPPPPALAAAACGDAGAAAPAHAQVRSAGRCNRPCAPCRPGGRRTLGLYAQAARLLRQLQVCGQHRQAVAGSPARQLGREGLGGGRDVLHAGALVPGRPRLTLGQGLR